MDKLIGWRLTVLAVLSALLIWHWPVVPRAPIELTQPRRMADHFPPPYPSRPRTMVARPISPRDELLALTQLTERPMALAQRLREAADLYELVLGEWQVAAAGNGVAQHTIYQALDECRPFLRLDPTLALSMNERMLGATSDLSPRERQQWERSYRRCVGFAIHDWSPVVLALGDDQPGAITEVASVWFARAVAASYPPALAEQALRAGTLSTSERQQRLHAALRSGHPEALVLCFLHQLEIDGTLLRSDSLAWLILACRAGLDCSLQATWLSDASCAENCGDDTPPLLHYWDALDAEAQQQVQSLVSALPAKIRNGRFDELPMPDLAALSQLDR